MRGQIHKTRIHTEFDAPIGKLLLIAGDRTLLRVLLPGESRDRSLVGNRCNNTSEEPPLKEAVEFLTRYFKSEPVSWKGKPIPGGTEFLQRLWQATAAIPFGKTVSYGDLAARVGIPLAARAVGQGMARNPLPILVPCHRVIAADGSLGGYGGGLEMKRWLLRHEGIVPK